MKERWNIFKKSEDLPEEPPILLEDDAQKELGDELDPYPTAHKGSAPLTIYHDLFTNFVYKSKILGYCVKIGILLLLMFFVLNYGTVQFRATWCQWTGAEWSCNKSNSESIVQ